MDRPGCIDQTSAKGLAAVRPRRPREADGVLEKREALAQGRKRHPQYGRLMFEPACPDAEVRAAAGEHVQGRGQLDEQRRMPIDDPRDQRAETDPRGVSRDEPKRGVRLEHRVRLGRSPCRDLEEVVHEPEAGEASLLSTARDPGDLPGDRRRSARPRERALLQADPHATTVGPRPQWYKFDVRRSSLPAPVRVRIDAAPAYELVLSMSVAASGADTTIARSLHHAAPELAADVARFASSDWMWAHLMTVVAESPAPRDAASFFAHLESLPAREVLRLLVGYYVRWFRRMASTALMDAAIARDPIAIRDLLASSQPDDPAWQRSLRSRLEAGPSRTKEDLVRLVQGWDETVFTPVLLPAQRRLKSAASLRRRSLSARTAHEVVAAFAGWDYVPEPGITRVLVVPSLVIDTIHEFEYGQTKIVCVPLARVVTPRVPTELLRAVRALADESRLRIVIALAAGDLGAQELADRSSLGLTTVLHHLGSLRAAGLVAGGGRRRPYRLRPAAMRIVADRIRDLVDR